MPRAFTRKSAVTVWIDPRSRMLVLGTIWAMTAGLLLLLVTLTNLGGLPLIALNRMLREAGIDALAQPAS